LEVEGRSWGVWGVLNIGGAEDGGDEYGGDEYGMGVLISKRGI
jgi:hypothetical protein